MKPIRKSNSRKAICQLHCPRCGPEEKPNMKAIFIEPLLVVASSILWIFVLPLAAVIHAGVAILDRVDALMPCEISFASPG